MSKWKIEGEDRRGLFKRIIQLQLDYVMQELDYYLDKVDPDSCISDIWKDVEALMIDVYGEAPPNYIKEIESTWELLKETQDGDNKAGEGK